MAARTKLLFLRLIVDVIRGSKYPNTEYIPKATVMNPSTQVRGIYGFYTTSIEALYS